MGPLLLSRLFNLNDIQSGVLSLVFKIADDNGLLLLDSKDLRAMLQYAGDNADQFTTEYGRISAASVGAIQRSLLDLESQGGDKLFGEPALNLDDFLQTDGKGRGMINILAADKLMLSPKLYATFLLWMLAELYEQMPEVGDLEKPKLVFFFDEAHLLFTDAPEPLLQKIEQIIRLIRSKGVGVFFVTQNPLDIPDVVLGQLGNRVQHALRAFTPRDQKAVKAAAETLRANPKLDVSEKVISELAVGEALVSFLDEKGQPGVVERAFICPPKSQIGPIPPATRGRDRPRFRPLRPLREEPSTANRPTRSSRTAAARPPRPNRPSRPAPRAARRSPCPSPKRPGSPSAAAAIPCSRPWARARSGRSAAQIGRPSCAASWAGSSAAGADPRSPPGGEKNRATAASLLVSRRKEPPRRRTKSSSMATAGGVFDRDRPSLRPHPGADRQGQGPGRARPDHRRERDGQGADRPGRSIPAAAAPGARSSPSTAGPSPTISWRASCSGTPAARSPARCATRPA